MLHNWFDCAVRYDAVQPNGLNKKVTEHYLVDALSYTEAENRFLEIITPLISGEFVVTNISRARYSETFSSDDTADEFWFKIKMGFVTINEKTGEESITPNMILVQAADLRTAIKNFDEGMKGSLADYVILGVNQTPIVEVCPYTENVEHPEFMNKAQG